LVRKLRRLTVPALLLPQDPRGLCLQLVGELI
jgi:hypothetical protein